MRPEGGHFSVSQDGGGLLPGLHSSAPKTDSRKRRPLLEGRVVPGGDSIENPTVEARSIPSNSGEKNRTTGQACGRAFSRLPRPRERTGSGGRSRVRTGDLLGVNHKGMENEHLRQWAQPLRSLAHCCSSSITCGPLDPCRYQPWVMLLCGGWAHYWAQSRNSATPPYVKSRKGAGSPGAHSYPEKKAVSP